MPIADPMKSGTINESKRAAQPKKVTMVMARVRCNTRESRQS